MDKVSKKPVQEVGEKLTIGGVFFFLMRFSSSGVLITLSDSMNHARNNDRVTAQSANNNNVRRCE
jgi:hypothetical protein